MSNKSGSFWMVSIILILTISISMGIWLLHSAWIYYQLTALQIASLKGRHSRAVIAIILFGSSYFLIYFPLIALHQLPGFNGFSPETFNILFTILTQLTALIYPFLIVYRSWMVYYKIKWNIAIQDTKWSIFIDRNANKNNWYLKHYEANKKNASRILTVIWLIFAVPSWLFSFLGANFSTLFYGLQYFLPILMLTILLYKIPKYDDVFMIRSEIKMIIIATLITTILYVPFLILQAIFVPWGHLALLLYTLAGPFSILYPHLYFPFNKFHLPKTYCSLKMYRSNTNLQELQVAFRTNAAANDENGPFGLKECIQNEDGFLVFTRHMNKEFAIENMLFMIEMYQFKRKLKVLYGTETLLKSGDDILETIIFPENNMPKSTLIENMELLDVHRCVSELFMKYIVDDAYFAINVAYEDRTVLYRTFQFDKRVHSNADNVVAILTENIMKQEMKENDIFHLFDNVIQSISRLLRGSFHRFKQSDEYKRLLSV